VVEKFDDFELMGFNFVKEPPHPDWKITEVKIMEEQEMKPEPLKDKALRSIHDTIDCDIYKDKDIQSAVLWLKRQLMENNKRDYTDMCKLINEAFEDIFNKKKKL